MAVFCLPGPASADHDPVPDDPVDTGVLSPSNDTAPTISGIERDGSVLTGNDGAWSNATTLTRFWLRCDSAGENCVHQGGPTTNYTLTGADIGKVIKFRVRATNATGQNEEEDETAVIAPAPPVNTADPSFNGQARDGQLLDGNRGTWTGTPTITYAFQWLRCPSSCSPIAGATSENYVLTPADVGKRVRLQVTATGPGGQATDSSPLSAVIALAASGSGSSPTPGGISGGLRALRPFPIVAIGGRVFGSGAVLTELLIRRAPKGSRITITCRGRGCPFKRARYRMRRSSLRIRRLQRRLGGGAVITIFIRKGNTIGKYTRIRIRRGQAPARLDRCVRPGSSKPTRCP